MTDCIKQFSLFPAVKSRKIQVDFNGGNITSDGGGLLVRQADRKLKLTLKLAGVLNDPPRQKSCDHKQLYILRQRIYGLALGYKDLSASADPPRRKRSQHLT